MKTARDAISEYYLELPKSIEDLQRQFLGLQNNAPVIKNTTTLPPLHLEESDKEENDTCVPSLTLADSEDEESDTQACPLTLVYIGKEEKTSDDTIATSHGSILALGRKVKKFFQVLGWFSGEVVDALFYEGNTQMYTIRFNDREEEMWSMHDSRLNSGAASITVGDRGFQFISKICWGGHFSGTVVEILRGEKRN